MDILLCEGEREERDSGSSVCAVGELKPSAKSVELTSPGDGMMAGLSSL